MNKQKNTILRAIPISKVLMIAGAITLIATGFLLAKPAKVLAQPGDLTLAETKYPFIKGTALDDCSLCHTDPPDLNAYGVDYFLAGRNLAAFDLIKDKDSDGDGFTNIQEINALTNPGDPLSFPAGASATPTKTTLPPTATFTPTFTSTSRPPTATFTPTFTSTNLPPTATFTPTNTVTGVPPTATFTPTFTSTSLPPTATFTPTNTVTGVPPTATFTPTFTSTSMPPTATFTPTATVTIVPPTATFTPTATATSVPPTATFTPTPTSGPPSGFDLDIQNFITTPTIQLRMVKPVRIWLDIRNTSQFNGNGLATVTGVQNGIVVYHASMIVTDLVGAGFTRFVFPGYEPVSSGKIVWTATVDDGNPDKDVWVTFNWVMNH